MAVVRDPSNDLLAQRGNSQLDAYMMGHGDAKLATIYQAGIVVTTRYVLIDLSDTVNFPHSLSGKLRLFSLAFECEKIAANSDFQLDVGVVTDDGVAAGDVDWFWTFHIAIDRNGADDLDWRIKQLKWFGGLDLEVSGNAMVNLITNNSVAADANWRAGAGPYLSPRGAATAPPGNGDLVLLLTRTAGTMDFCIAAEYSGEST